MRALVQRVSEADVSIAGTVVGQSGPGLLVLICAMQGDSDKTAQTMATKLAKLRIFKDAEGKMNHSVCEVGGSALVVSQFTLAADTRRGTRPGFSSAARPEEGERLYELFVQILKAEGVPVETGRFGAEMQVRLVNDGPVTIWLEV